MQSIIFNDKSDVELGVKYLPLEPLRVESFVVDYPGTEDAWGEVLKCIRVGKESPFDWMLATAQLKIGPAD